jgi:hypothetical protein
MLCIFFSSLLFTENTLHSLFYVACDACPTRAPKLSHFIRLIWLHSQFLNHITIYYWLSLWESFLSFFFQCFKITKFIVFFNHILLRSTINAILYQLMLCRKISFKDSLYLFFSLFDKFLTYFLTSKALLQK